MNLPTYFTLTFMVRKSQQKRTGEVPIFARITISGQRTEFNINRSVDPENWNTSRGMAKGRSKKDIELNKYLDSIRVRMSEIHAHLLQDEAVINPLILKQHFLGNIEGPKMLCAVFRDVIGQYRDKLERGDICKSTYLRWERCEKYLSEFLAHREGVADIPIKKLTSGMIDDFEHFLRVNKENGNNAAVKYIRYLKKVTRVAIANKWLSEDPFIDKRYTRTVANREALTEKEVKSIMALNLTALPRLDQVRDIFIFCCFTGLAFVDISTLTRNQIIEDEHGECWIRKNRQKTDELSCIPLLDIPRRIADKYKNHPTVIAKGVVLPVISNQRMNSYLAEIATLAKVHKHLTTHIARHTFATVSLRNHVPLETISKMLGHSDIQTTQIYAKMVDEAISEDMRKMRDKFDGIEITISPLPDKPTDFEREPLKKRGRPRKNPV